MSETPERKFDLKAADAARAVEGISEAELRARVRELAEDTDALKRTLANSEANYQRDRADAAEAKLRAVETLVKEAMGSSNPMDSYRQMARLWSILAPTTTEDGK